MADLFSRRAMLVGAGGAAATAGVVGIAGSDAVKRFSESLKTPAAAGNKNAQLKSATLADWRLQIGTDFKATTGHVLRLTSVAGFPTTSSMPRGVRTQAFLARFDIKKGGKLPDKTYRFSHPTGGTFDMFVTTGDPVKGLKMIAVFG